MSLKNKISETFLDRKERNIFFPKTQLAPQKEILIYGKEAFDTGILPPQKKKKKIEKLKRRGKKKAFLKSYFFHSVKERGNAF